MRPILSFLIFIFSYSVFAANQCGELFSLPIDNLSPAPTFTLVQKKDFLRGEKGILNFQTDYGVRSLDVNLDLSQEDLSFFTSTSYEGFSMLWNTDAVGAENPTNARLNRDVFDGVYPVFDSNGTQVASVARKALSSMLPKQQSEIHVALVWIAYRLANHLSAGFISDITTINASYYKITFDSSSVLMGERFRKDYLTLDEDGNLDQQAEGLALIGVDGSGHRLMIDQTSGNLIVSKNKIYKNIGTIPADNLDLINVRIFSIPPKTIFEIPYARMTSGASSVGQENVAMAAGFATMVLPGAAKALGVLMSVNQREISNALSHPAQYDRTSIRISIDEDGNVEIVP